MLHHQRLPLHLDRHGTFLTISVGQLHVWRTNPAAAAAGTRQRNGRRTLLATLSSPPFLFCPRVNIKYRRDHVYVLIYYIIYIYICIDVLPPSTSKVTLTTAGLLEYSITFEANGETSLWDYSLFLPNLKTSSSTASYGQ